MNKFLNEYAVKQQNAIAASIKLNETTDKLIKDLDQLQELFKNE